MAKFDYSGLRQTDWGDLFDALDRVCDDWEKLELDDLAERLHKAGRDDVVARLYAAAAEVGRKSGKPITDLRALKACKM